MTSKLNRYALLCSIVILIFAIGVVVKKIHPTYVLIRAIETEQQNLYKRQLALKGVSEEKINIQDVAKNLDEVQDYLIQSIQNHETLFISNIDVVSEDEQYVDQILLVDITGSQKELISWLMEFDEKYNKARFDSFTLLKEKKSLILKLQLSLLRN